MSNDKPSGPTKVRVPAGDDRPRLVCDTCGFIHYSNPRIVVGAICHWEERILLCRRAIEPRRGYWTMPAGYLEENETTAEGARRETREEALAEVELDALLAVYDIPRINQVQMIYRGRLLRPEYGCGEETEEIDLFRWEDIPWNELAFPSVHWALKHDREVAGLSEFAPRSTPEEWLKRREETVLRGAHHYDANIVTPEGNR